jgi:hypothetical protein
MNFCIIVKTFFNIVLKQFYLNSFYVLNKHISLCFLLRTRGVYE